MKTTRYIRYSTPGSTAASYGILDGETIQELRGDIFAGTEPTGKTLSLKDVKLLVPCTPLNVAAVGRNYQTHIKAMSQMNDNTIPAAVDAFRRTPPGSPCVKAREPSGGEV